MQLIKRLIGHIFLRILGWRMRIPEDMPKRCIVIIAPHTSSWDFPIGLAGAWSVGIRFRYLGKDSLFKGPFGWLFRWTGGIPVDRSGGTNIVKDIARHMKESDSMILTLAPEGTRSPTKFWRSGFYYIAKEAKAPLLLASINYETKQAEVGPEVILTGNETEDMDHIRAYYKDVVAKHPEKFGPIRLRKEAPIPSAQQE